MLTKINECITNTTSDTCCDIINTDFEVYDCPDTGRCFAVENCIYDEQIFSVTNSTNKSIYFFAIDRCLIPANGPERCDCLVTDKKTFCFVEIKEFKSTTKNTAKSRKKARSQLLSTITLFKSTVVLPINCVLEAYMCVGIRRRVPSVRATDMAVKMKFAVLDTTLYQGTTKVFDA